MAEGVRGLLERKVGYVEKVQDIDRLSEYNHGVLISSFLHRLTAYNRMNAVKMIKQIHTLKNIE